MDRKLHNKYPYHSMEKHYLEPMNSLFRSNLSNFMMVNQAYEQV